MFHYQIYVRKGKPNFLEVNNDDYFIVSYIKTRNSLENVTHGTPDRYKDESIDTQQSKIGQAVLAVTEEYRLVAYLHIYRQQAKITLQ